MNTKQPIWIVRFSAAAVVLVLNGWTPTAIAQVTATLTAGVHLRAGPDIFYPSVMIMPPGAGVQVFGCVSGFDWCDVQFGASRGWVDAAFLQAVGPGGPVIIASSPAVIGVPSVTFSFNNYWNTYYVGRPWYARRGFYYNHWNRFPQGRPPPIYRPPPPVFRPPPGGTRPPSGGRPPSSRPPSSGRPPAGGQPPGNRPPGTTRPAPGTPQ